MGQVLSACRSLFVPRFRVRTAVHSIGALLMCIAAGSTSLAQQTTVQQPVIESFSVGTTVSVPDRGRAFLGGAGSAASSRSAYGPLRSNSNYGSAFQSSNVAVNAWIHDFDELDRQALSKAAVEKRRAESTRLDERAEHAYRSLLSRRSDERPAAVSSVAAPAPSAPRSTDATPLSADELYRRGLKAEAAGQRGVARAYLRTAGDHGSAAAREKLDRPAPSRK
jgi:hypothetical protein